jgi:hypothetical protein
VEIRPLKGATETKSSLLIGTREELERVVKFVNLITLGKEVSL